ncbi:MAG: LCP family protein, partial [Blautia sp.]|nr:LCP family protein [Blautia sp.]
MSGSKKNTRHRRRVLFVVEILVLFLFLGGLFIYGQVTMRLQKMEKPQVTEIQFESGQKTETQIKVNETAPTITGYRTYAVFGLDHRERNEELAGYNSDSIIIVSIDNDSKDVRMVSVYRDTLLDIGEEVYAKANAAYAYGGPLQAVNALNRNLDLKITDYVSVDFSAVVDLVDAVGGIDVPLSYAEIVHLNNYCLEVSEETGKSYVPISLPEPVPEDQEATLGNYHLNGVQATSYCRIRYTASLDMGRTERQRRVIQLVVQKLKKGGVTNILNIL